MWSWKFPFYKPTQTVKVMQPDIKSIPLKADQYYASAQKKTHIFLHHTAGGSAASSIAHWAANPEHIATAFIIDRDGTIYRTFDEKYWAYHLGVKGLTSLEKASIGIEICSYGALELKKGKMVTYTGKEIDPDKAVRLDVPYKGFQHWEAYTPPQIASLKQLLPYLIEKFQIKLQSPLDRKNFYDFREPKTLNPGVWSHTTIRQDKYDIFPQKELVDLVYSL